MKFKKLNEEFTSDDLYQVLIDYIYDKLEHAVDNLAVEASSDVEDYDVDYCSEEVNQSSQYAYNKLRQAAEYFAEFLLWNAPEVIHESLNEDVDASQFIGKPLRDFLKTIDHRTKINIESENGFDDYGNKGGSIGGLNGLAHDVGWYMADMIIKDIKQPTEHQYWKYDILIENCEKKDELKESIPEKKLYKDAEDIADRLSIFLDSTSRIENLDDYLDEYDLEHLGKSMDALYDFAQAYSYNEKNESLLTEIASESRFNDPIRFKISVKAKEDQQADRLYEYFMRNMRNMRFTPEVLSGSVDGLYEIAVPGEKDWIERIKELCNDSVFPNEVSLNESLLTEKNWKHQLPSGAKLRKAIDDEDYATLKSTLMDCYREINQLIPDDFEEYELEDKLEELEILDTEPDEEIDIDEQDVEDNWNYELDTFYDICDAYNIWIPLE